MCAALGAGRAQQRASWRQQGTRALAGRQQGASRSPAPAALPRCPAPAAAAAARPPAAHPHTTPRCNVSPPLYPQDGVNGWG